MIKYERILIGAIILSSIAFFSYASPQEDATSHVTKHVILENVDGKYSLYVNGELFYIKGAGLDFNEKGISFKALSDAGGNAFRTWRTKDAECELDSAAKYDLLVAMGLDIEKELHGFDYNDTVAVAHQLEVMKKRVLKYKDHPNLLCWVAGNELNLLLDENQNVVKEVNPKVYDALSELVDFIHEVDINHPVTFTTAGMNASHVSVALERVPQIDFISYQVYGDLVNLQEHIEMSGIDKPYIVSEYGPVGHWEVPATEWGREIEQNTTVRAKGMDLRITKGINADTTHCLGSFVFIWGQKQERTPTWYGVFIASGEATASLDVVQKHWTGEYPSNRAPEITDSIRIDGQTKYENVYLDKGQSFKGTVKAISHEEDSLSYVWEVMDEINTRSQGGAAEKAANVIDSIVISSTGNTVSCVAPEKEGDYRLFVYIFDGNNKVACANIPFYVKK